MSGYTPIFDSVYRGTLCGKWPTLPVWMTILPMADKNGQIDLTYQAIAALTGWPLDLLKQAIGELMQPDPESRSGSEDGRRLTLIEPENRQWGWRVVNHGLYREKARKMAYDSKRTESGADAVRKREERGNVPTRPDASRDIPLSNSNTNSNTEKSKRARKRASRCPEDFSPDLDLARSQLSGVDADREAQKFRDWEFRTPRSDWAAAWRNWVEKCRESGRYAKAPAGGLMVNGKPVEWQ